MKYRVSYQLFLGLAIVISLLLGTQAQAWEPTKPVEFIIPAGTGGGADVMARFISPLISKHNLSPQPFIAINKSGGAGAEGFTYVKGKKGDTHVIIITLSNLFTTPLATGVPFNWRDLTPIARLALDEFVLWVNSETPYKTAKEYIDAVKKSPGTFKMAGTGSAQEDQIKGGGDVAVELVGKHVDSTVNNPIEAVSHWKAGRVRPLAIFDTERLNLPDWKTIPTIKEALGQDIHYLMLRGIFAAPGIPKDVQDWYVNVMKKVTETPEWKKFTDDGGLKRAFLSGPEYVKWLDQTEQLHKDLMTKGGLIKK
jgi:putative tricarboxylic transport membrane protein